MHIFFRTKIDNDHIVQEGVASKLTILKKKDDLALVATDSHILVIRITSRDRDETNKSDDRLLRREERAEILSRRCLNGNIVEACFVGKLGKLKKLNDYV